MATMVEPRGETQPYVDADEYVDFQLSKTQAQIKTNEILTASVWLGLSALLYLFAFVLLDQWVIPGGFSGWSRAIWLSLLLVGGGGWGVWRILMPSFRSIHEMYAAKMIESADPTLKSSLLNWVDLQVHDRKTQSALVQTSMEKRAAIELAKVNVDHAVNQRELQRLAYSLLGVIVVCSLYVMLSPKDAFSSLERFILPMSQTSVATRTNIANVTPGDTKVLAGEMLIVEADILGQDPAHVNLVYTTNDQEFVNQPVEMSRAEASVSRFVGTISGEKGRGLMQGITYHIEAGDARTRDFKVQVVEPPSSKVLNVSYRFPDYMRLDPKNHPGGQIDAWEGTKVVVTAETNIPVNSALLVMTDTENPHAKGEEIRMTITKDKQLSAEWTLGFRSDGTFARYYHIECTTEAGESDPLPIVYAIKIQPDQRPDIALLHPTQDLERPANATIPLLVKAIDPDFQLRFVTLRVEKGGEELHSAALLDEERPSFEGTHDLRLEKLGQGGAGLQPGEEIIYWIEARDNKQPHGNRSVTPRLKVKITAPAKPEEVAQQLEQDREHQKKELEQANLDRNQEGEDKKPEEQKPQDDPKQDKPREDKPKEKNPERKPGDPKQAQEQKRPDQDKTQEQEQPNQQGKPEDQQQAGKGEQGAKSKSEPGTQGDKTQQTGEQKNGAKGEKSKPGHGGKNDQADSKDDESTEESLDGQGAGANSKQRKKTPAKDEDALKKLIERQQELDPAKPENDPQNAEENKDEAGAEGTDEGKQQENENGRSPKSGNKQPKSKPDQGNKADNEGSEDKQNSESSADNSDHPMGAKPKTGEKQNPSDKTEEDKSGGDKDQASKKQADKQPKSTDQNTDKTAADKTQDKSDQTGADKQAMKKPGDKASNKQTGDKAAQKQGAAGDNQAMQKKPGGDQNAEQQPNSDQTDKKNSDGSNPNSADKKNSTGKAPQNKPEGEEGKAEEKNADSNNADMATDKTDKNGEKSPMPAEGEAPKDKAPKSKTEKDPGAKGGTAKDANSDDKAAAKKEGSGNKPGAPMPGDDPMKTEKGPGNGQKPGDKKQPDKPKQPSEGAAENKQGGEETPAEDDGNAVKKEATGDEKGEAEGQTKPEGDKAPRAKNDLERKPESKPGAMRKSDEPPMPGTKNEKTSKDPDETKAKPDGSERPEEQKKGENKSSGQPPEKRPGTDASQDEPNPGKGEKNQKSKQPDTGEGGGNTPQDQGTPGSKQKGTGDKQQEEGNQTPAGKNETGKPSGKSGSGSKTQPKQEGTKAGKGGKESDPNGSDSEEGGSKSNGEPKPGESKPGEAKGGQQQSKPGEAGAGKPGAQQGGKSGNANGQNRQPGAGAAGENQPGNPQQDGNGDPNGERRNLNPAEQTQADEEAAEKANEEFARKASNLVLKKLRKDLDRGEVDQKLLDELGWTKEDMERFVHRLETQLQDPGEDNSPEAAARRRQFEETLKTLGLSSKTKKRTATSAKKTQAGQLEIRKTAPPPEYRELYEEYTKELAKPTK